MTHSTPRKVALITGSGRGLGQAFADRLARDGYNLILADLKPPAATAEAAEDCGVEALAVAADVSSPDAVAALHEQAISRFGRVDVLVNNAGWGQVIPFEDTTFDHWHKVFAINLDGVYLTCKAFLPGMREQGWGRVINMASNTLQLVLPWGFAPYVASKGAIVGLTRALATEYGPHGVTVNAISPGLTKTPGTTELFGGGTGAMAEAQAIKRPEVPEDLVGTLAFLASDDAAFITGQTITVDGGMARL